MDNKDMNLDSLLESYEEQNGEMKPGEKAYVAYRRRGYDAGDCACDCCRIVACNMLIDICVDSLCHC